MTDETFDPTIATRLASYAERGVRPIDPYAVARSALLPRRRVLGPPIGGAWLRPALLVMVGIAVLAGIAAVGSFLLRDETTPIHRVFTGKLVHVGDLSTPRAPTTVVELADGRVLVVGGNAGERTTAELFDPASGGSVVTDPMVSAGDQLRVSAAARLRDGRVLLVGDAGGAPGSFHAVAQVFDPATATFSEVGPMLTPRASAKLAMLADGRVVMAGGTLLDDQQTPVASAEVFDPATGRFTATGSMSTPRAGHALVALPDGGILALGGVGADGTSGLSSAELYDPATGTWSDAGSMSFAAPMAYLGGTDLAVALPDGRVVAFGQAADGGAEVPSTSAAAYQGRTAADIWDPATRSFRRIAAHLQAISGVASLGDGRILLVGVRPTPANNAPWAGVLDADQAARQTVPTPFVELPPPSAWAPMVAPLADGRVLLVGGWADGNGRQDGNGQKISSPAVTTVEAYGEPTEALTSPAPSSSAPAATAAVISDDGPWAAVYARRSTDGSSVEVITLAPDGSQRVVRSFATTGAGAVDVATGGLVARTGVGFLYWQGFESSGSGSIAVFDLGQPSRPPDLVPMGAPVGPRWSATGLLAIPGYKPSTCTSRGPECWAVVTILDPKTGATRSIGQVALFGGGPSIVWARDASGIWDGGRLRPIDGSADIAIKPGLLFMDRRLGAGGATTDQDGVTFASDGRARLTVTEEVVDGRHVAKVARSSPGGSTVLAQGQLPDGAFQPFLGEPDPSDTAFPIRFWTGDPSVSPTGSLGELRDGPILRVDGTTAEVTGGTFLGWVPAALAATWPSVSTPTGRPDAAASAGPSAAPSPGSTGLLVEELGRFGDLPVPIFGSARLADGRVLIVAGPSLRPQAWLFDPASKRIDPAGTMGEGEARAGSLVVGLADGRALVLGDQRIGASADLFDPASGAFTPTARPPTTRVEEPCGALSTVPWAAPHATRLPDGRVFVAGGTGPVCGGSGSADLYDPAAQRWTQLDIGCDAARGAQVLLDDGRLLIVCVGDDLDTRARLFDPSTDTFVEAAKPPVPIWAATRLSDGRVLLTGGTPLLYDPISDTYMQLPDGPHPVAATQGFDIGNGRALFLGDPRAAVHEPTLVFDSSTGMFTPIDRAGVEWADAMVPLADGRILTVGAYLDARLIDPSRLP